MRTTTHRSLDAYQFTVRPLSREEGGGYLVEYPDIPGCMSDGETPEEAIANGREALRDCLAVFRESGRKAPPKPGIERRSNGS
jgi:antitoxin HicB